MMSAVRALAVIIIAGAAAAQTLPDGVLGGPIGGTPAAVLWPVDDAASRADFFAFRATLQAALTRRDLDAVLAIVAPDIRNSFGGDDGVDGFLRLWRPHERDSRLWEELSTVLAYDKTFDRSGRFVAPYVFSRWPREVDPFDHVALVDADVRILAAPRADAEVVSTASFVILPLARRDRDMDSPEWTAIRTGDRTGYVPASLVRSPIGYRAFFERRGGGWQLVILVAGD